MKNENQKMKMSQDELRAYLKKHDMKTVRIAELMGITQQALISNFDHHKNAHGYPRRFSVENIRKLNEALAVIASELRGCVLNFGTPEMFTNNYNKTYDPGLIKPMRRIGELMNLNKLTNRLLGWSAKKKESVISDASSKAYGHITEKDAIIINIELKEVSGLLEGVEIVPDENAFCGTSKKADSI